MKTVAELAGEIGVSKTAIRKKISELGLQPSLKYEKNRVVITSAQERRIKASFKNYNPETGTVLHPVSELTEKKTETEQEQVDEPIANSSQTDFRMYDDPGMVPSLVAVLQQQLEEKDRQLAEKDIQIHELHGQLHDFNERLKEAMTLTDQQQQLQLHQAHLLTAGQSASEPVDAEEAEEDTEAETSPPPEPEKEEAAPADPSPIPEVSSPEPTPDQPKKSFWKRFFGS